MRLLHIHKQGTRLSSLGRVVKRQTKLIYTWIVVVVARPLETFYAPLAGRPGNGAVFEGPDAGDQIRERVLPAHSDLCFCRTGSVGAALVARRRAGSPPRHQRNQAHRSSLRWRVGQLATRLRRRLGKGNSWGIGGSSLACPTEYRARSTKPWFVVETALPSIEARDAARRGPVRYFYGKPCTSTEERPRDYFRIARHSGRVRVAASKRAGRDHMFRSSGRLRRRYLQGGC
jgi:hypothetical protein